MSIALITLLAIFYTAIEKNDTCTMQPLGGYYEYLLHSILSLCLVPSLLWQLSLHNCPLSQKSFVPLIFRISPTLSLWFGIPMGMDLVGIHIHPGDKKDL